MRRLPEIAGASLGSRDIGVKFIRRTPDVGCTGTVHYIGRSFYTVNEHYMCDSSLPEDVALYRVNSELLDLGFIVAKPKPDLDGADLIIIPGYHIDKRPIRVQSKGRSLKNNKPHHIEIPKKYVDNSFVAFLYLRVPNKTKVYLYVFFPNEISSWYINKKNEYTLSLSPKTFSKTLGKYKWNNRKIKLLKRYVFSNSPGDR